jgi:dihydroorotase
MLTEDTVREFGANAAMSPPLRTESDRQAVVRALVDGTISVLATDHAPHTAAEKQRDLRAVPCGIVGLECAVSLTLTALVHTGTLSLSRYVAAFTVAPRAVLGLPGGTLAPGDLADLTVLDLNRAVTIDVSRMRSKSRNCPYHGRVCKGAPVATMVAGAWVFSSLPAVAEV